MSAYDEEGWMEEGPDALDDGIVGAVKALRAAGIETFSSCDGSPGHTHQRPLIWFNGDDDAGFFAEKVATKAGYQVFQVSRFWYSRQGERCGPFWEIAFVRGAAHRGSTTWEVIAAQLAAAIEPFTKFDDRADYAIGSINGSQINAAIEALEKYADLRSEALSSTDPTTSL